MPIFNRLTRTIQGGITSTGNTLGIVSPTSSGNTYTITSYISTNSALQVAGYPPGTTTNNTLASSNAYLNIPSGSKVVYAELMWVAFGNTVPVPVQPVTFSTPSQSNISISPITADIIPLAAFGYNWSWNHADVTSLVNTAGAGYYSVGNIYSVTIPPGITATGWTLMVAYENNNLPYRYITINTGLSIVSDTSPNTYTITNFVTPSSGQPKGYLLMAYSFGDFGDGANLFVGPNTSSLTQLGNTGSTASPWNGVAPYNPRSNMFTSLVCIADPENSNIGNLDTRGTFGTYNAAAYVNPGYRGFSRSLYDITGFNISNTLTNNQNSLSVRITFSLTGGSAYIQNESIQVDIQSAKLAPITKSVDRDYGSIGDTLTYTVTFKNTGLVTANNTVFIDTIPNGGTYVADSFIYNGTSIAGGNPNPPGVTIGSVPPDGVVTISFKAKVTTLPSPSPMLNTAGLSYNFVSAPGLSPISAFDTSNTVSTTINNGDLTSVKTVDKAYAKVGDILTYTIVLTNIGNVSTNNIQFVDVIPQGTALVANSFKENGVTITNPNPDVAVPLKSITVGGVTTVTFKVQITTMPPNNPIPNQSRAIYSYFFSPSQTGKSGDNYSNTVFTQVNNANLGNTMKYVDKNYADCGETINYTIVVPNTGNVTAQNVVFKDTIPNGTSFVTTSVYVNGVQQLGANPTTGITIPNIAPGTTTTINFSVKVNC